MSPLDLKENEQYVLVFDGIKNVFCGIATEPLPSQDPSIHLRQCRQIRLHSNQPVEVTSLADKGPSDGCRAGPAMDCMIKTPLVVITISKKRWRQFEALTQKH